MTLTPNEAYTTKRPFVDKETLEHIVEQFPTPFHLYDEAGIRRNMQEVRDAFAWNPGFKEYFAVKANPNPTHARWASPGTTSCSRPTTRRRPTLSLPTS